MARASSGTACHVAKTSFLLLLVTFCPTSMIVFLHSAPSSRSSYQYILPIGTNPDAKQLVSFSYWTAFLMMPLDSPSQVHSGSPQSVHTNAWVRGRILTHIHLFSVACAHSRTTFQEVPQITTVCFVRGRGDVSIRSQACTHRIKVDASVILLCLHVLDFCDWNNLRVFTL